LSSSVNRSTGRIGFGIGEAQAALNRDADHLAAAIGKRPVQRIAKVGVDARKLGEVHVRIAASPVYLEQFGKPQHWQDIRQHQCLQTGFGIGEAQAALNRDADHLAAAIGKRPVQRIAKPGGA
jgi:histone H3/H4